MINAKSLLFMLEHLLAVFSHHNYIKYKGTIKRCLPTVEFPSDWHITCSSNHWSNESTMIMYLQNSLFPYIDNCIPYCTIAVVPTYHGFNFKTCSTSIHFHVNNKRVNCDCGFDILVQPQKIVFRAYPRKFCPSKISSHTVNMHII